MSGLYLASALGGNLRITLTAAEVAELWDATAEDMRERDDDGSITLWARAEDPRFSRIAPLYFRPVESAVA